MFGKGIKLFSLFGFKVRIDFSWLILGLLITWSLAQGFFPNLYPDLPQFTYWIMGVSGAVGIFLSIVLHELSHSLVARNFGIPISGITLFIFGGVAHMTDEPKSPRAEFLMAIAGPIFSVIFGGTLYGSYLLMKYNSISSPVLGVMEYLGYLNFILAGFNMVPAFPLDGGRVLRSALWKAKNNVRWATKVASRVGSTFAIALIILGVLRALTGNIFGGVWLFLIGMFLQHAAKSSYQQLIMRQMLEGFTVRRFMNPNVVAVSPGISIQDLVENYFYQHHFKMYPVVDNENLVGCITVEDVKKVPTNERDRHTIREYIDGCNDDNSIGADDDAINALSKMSRTRTSKLLVVDQGKLVGVITLKDIMQLLSIKIDLES